MVKFSPATSCLLALAAIVIAADANSIADNKDDKPKCSVVQDSFPNEETLKPKLVKNADNTALLNVTSYLVLLDKPKSGYQPLDLLTVYQAKDATKGTFLLHLDFDCANYVVSAVKTAKDPKEPKYSITSIEIRLKAQNEKETELTCSSGKLDLEFPVAKRFSCLGRLVYNCFVATTDEEKRTYSKPVAQIVFANGLEIELEGEPEAIKSDKFSHDAFEQSCPQ